MYSIQIDSTQDISVSAQYSIIIRYVTDSIHECLLSLSNCALSTGEGLLHLVRDVLMSNGIDVTKCVGSSTDGAANMRGQYNGFSAWLSRESPGQINVWCYAHILNLVIINTTQVSLECVLLFGPLNTCALFFQESLKWMDFWRQNAKNGHSKLDWRYSLVGQRCLLEKSVWILR